LRYFILRKNCDREKEKFRQISLKPWREGKLYALNKKKGNKYMSLSPQGPVSRCLKKRLVPERGEGLVFKGTKGRDEKKKYHVMWTRGNFVRSRFTPHCRRKTVRKKDKSR